LISLLPNRRDQKIKYFLSIDTEGKFNNTVHLDKTSYYYSIHEGCREIARLAKKHNIKVTFFIDYPEIQFFDSLGKDIIALLNDLNDNGHSIQLHVHPAVIEGNSSPDLSSYSISEIETIIKDGCDTIENTVGKRPVAFRAGGYSVGNWPKIYNAINKSGITIDSSTYSGGKNLHNAKFDFKNLENMTPYFPGKESLHERLSSGLLEFPITTAIKCSNSLEGSFFRFDPNNQTFLLKIYTNYLLNTQKNIFINMIYHSKQVFNDDGSFNESFHRLNTYLEFLQNKNYQSLPIDKLY